MADDRSARPAPPSLLARTSEHGGVLLHPDAAVVDERWLDPAFWPERRVASGGRGAVFLIDTPLGAAVLRHYRRGGLIARFNEDRYFWHGADSTRAFEEMCLLNLAAHDGLPAPTPLAARYVRDGCYYRADILLRAIGDAETLAARLERAPSAIPWQGLGATIARFHRVGIDHADLNAHNVLIDGAGRVWLIDFDRGRLRKPGGWSHGNLARLKRSLQKLGAASAVVDFERAAWPALIEAWGEGMAR